MSLQGPASADNPDEHALAFRSCLPARHPFSPIWMHSSKQPHETIKCNDQAGPSPLAQPHWVISNSTFSDHGNAKGM
eukprot:9133397-Alexandrium_andersonii.AAC.1